MRVPSAGRYDPRVDSHLRAYLERPVPRPPLFDSRYDDRKWGWLAPLGCALTGGFVVGNVVAEREDWWLGGAVVWVALILGGVGLGRLAGSLAQSLFRHGTFATAQVVDREVAQDGEDRVLRVTFTVALAAPAHGYRDAGAVSHRSYRVSLGERWFGGDDHAPFKQGAEFPILMSAKRASALVFVQEEAIDAARIPGPPDRLPSAA